MKNMKKILVLSLAALLLVAVSVGGTIAYLTATSGPVENTFTPAGIAIKLDETKQSDGTVVDTGVTNWTAKMVPGVTYSKNPKVTLTKADCAVYIFITVEDSTAGAVSYTIDSTNWSPVPGKNDVWYREAATTDVNKSWDILTDDQVTIATTLGQSTTMPTSDVKITFNAYAIQKDAATTVAAAWEQIAPTTDGE